METEDSFRGANFRGGPSGLRLFAFRGGELLCPAAKSGKFSLATLAGEELIPKKLTFLIRISAGAVASALLLFMCDGLSSAQSTSGAYTLLVAAGFLCDPGGTGACPAVAKSGEGESYEISGAGTFDAQNKSVKAAGTFTHKSPNGNVLETGVWVANELVSFDSYGIARGALVKKEPGPGPVHVDPKRLPKSSGLVPTGGLAIFRIRLLPMSGAAKNATLQVNCALGDVPRDRAVEGIRVIVEKSAGEFTEEISGRVQFLSMRPEAGSTGITQAPENAPEITAEPPNR